MSYERQGIIDAFKESAELSADFTAVLRKIIDENRQLRQQVEDLSFRILRLETSGRSGRKPLPRS